MGLFDIGIRSLLSSQQLLNITGQNIANANTPFYSRRQGDLKEVNQGSFGNGVTLSQIRRIVDESANRALAKSSTQLSQSSMNLNQLQQLESLLDDETNGLSQFINEGVNALNQMNANPANAQPRSFFLAQLKNISERFHTLSSKIQNIQQNINQKINHDIEQINSISERIAYLNGQISLSGTQANPEQLDERNKLLQDLSQFLDVTTHADSKGNIQVTLSNGSSLIQENKSLKLLSKNAANHPGRLELFLQNGQSQTNITDVIKSGELAGLRDFQNTALNSTQNALGRLSVLLAQNVNQQNHLGIDLNGNKGADIFLDPNSPEAMSKRVFANTHNQGQANIDVQLNDLSALSTSDYELIFTSATDYKLVRNNDHKTMTTGTFSSLPFNIEADGFSMKINNGVFQAGDKYSILPCAVDAQNMALTTNDATKLALAWPVVSEASASNTGSGQLKITAMSDANNASFATEGQLSPPLSIVFTSNDRYQIINANNGQIIEDNLSYDPHNTNLIFPTPSGFDPGYRVTMSGDMQHADRFNLSYNSKSSGDNRNGLALMEQLNQGMLEHGSMNFMQGYGQLSHQVSALTSAALMTNESNQIIEAQAQARQDQISGVSLEEETLSLARYQQSYEASAKILDTVKRMFDVLIGLTRS